MSLGSANRWAHRRKWNRYPRKALCPALVSQGQPFRERGKLAPQCCLPRAQSFLSSQNTRTFHSLLNAASALREMGGRYSSLQKTQLVAERGSGEMFFWGTVSRESLDTQAHGFNGSCLKSSDEWGGLGHKPSQLGPEATNTNPAILR